MKVTLARPYTAADGRSHKADANVTLPRSEALNLLHLGRARAYERPAPSRARKPASDETPTDNPTGKDA